MSPIVLGNGVVYESPIVLRTDVVYDMFEAAGGGVELVPWSSFTTRAEPIEKIDAGNASAGYQRASTKQLYLGSIAPHIVMTDRGDNKPVWNYYGRKSNMPDSDPASPQDKP